MADIVCDKCGSEISARSKFCPECGDPVTAADRVRDDLSDLETVKLVCPKCEEQGLQKAKLKGLERFTCRSCRAEFSSRMVRIRSKKSRGAKKEMKRTFTIRVTDFSGGEDLIEFVNANYDDFELKSKDIAAFSYIGDDLRLVQNMTVNRYMMVSSPSCYIASCVYGAGSEEVAALRRWRDDALLTSRTFRRFVRVYYRCSPSMIAYFGRSRLFKTSAKILLDSILSVIRPGR